MMLAKKISEIKQHPEQDEKNLLGRFDKITNPKRDLRTRFEMALDMISDEESYKDVYMERYDTNKKILDEVIKVTDRIYEIEDQIKEGKFEYEHLLNKFSPDKQKEILEKISKPDGLYPIHYAILDLMYADEEYLSESQIMSREEYYKQGGDFFLNKKENMEVYKSVFYRDSKPIIIKRKNIGKAALTGEDRIRGEEFYEYASEVIRSMDEQDRLL